MALFVYVLKIVVARDIYEPHLPTHLTYLRRLEDAGDLVLSGPFGDRTGGMIMVRAASLAEAQAIAEADPLVASGVDVYELHEWLPTAGDPSLIHVQRLSS